ncbi:MAG: DUF4358 domain-containing protein [Bacilli bacterium]|nr:DUF4358 domain-containing protein [Bacilli bacterium]
MKKVLIIIGAMLLLCGCQSNESITYLDINKASSALDSKYGNMNAMDKSELETIYGLDTSKFIEYQIKSSTSSNGNFYAIIKVDDANKKNAQDQMKNMFSILENQSNLYSPEAVKLLKNRLETSVGNYLIYIVSDNNNAYYDVLKGFIN